MGRSRSKADFLKEKGPAVKNCSRCGCRIPLSSGYDLCKECMKKELFPKVKDYISENEYVNEMVLAAELGIDKTIIHEWIQEGHLEYRPNIFPKKD